MNSDTQRRRHGVKMVTAETTDNGCDSDYLGIFGVVSSVGDKTGYVVDHLNNLQCNMQFDTATDYSIMTIDTYQAKFAEFP
jgi:hypothetical protein